ncbi:MAG: zinc metalloprotease [Flavobacteriaceae bacterium]|nr:zinc metalloprotease [Flavobacteriaceae bacterium]
MKKLTLTVAILAATFFSCTEESSNLNIEESLQSSTAEEAEIPEKRTCVVMENLALELENDSELEQKMNAIEKHTYDYEVRMAKEALEIPYGHGARRAYVINIPVVVHVLYNTKKENISLSQIYSQINVLNEDFNKRNADVSKTPAAFASKVASADFKFRLVAVSRKHSTITSWGTGNKMKYSYQGGADAWDTSKCLNIWVCNIGGGVLGYAQFPGGSANTDGVVVSPNVFGRTGYVSYPFNKGRTLTHEIGHWLNLRHIWGDGGCSKSDYVSDTPTSDRPNYGCPSYPTRHCSSTDMTMNYMDYVNDSCMYMFTKGQRTRMRSLFAVGGHRRSFIY